MLKDFFKRTTRVKSKTSLLYLITVIIIGRPKKETFPSKSVFNQDKESCKMLLQTKAQFMFQFMQIL